MRSAQDLALKYTAPAPETLPTVELSPTHLQELKARVDAFEAALDAPTNAQELVLSADEINALIEEKTAGETNAPKIFVNIDGDRLQGLVSIPLQDLGPLKLKGRYLNGQAILKVWLQNDTLRLQIEHLEVKGKPLPGLIMSELKKENFASEIAKDPKAASLVAKFESIQVTNGKVILRNKVKP